MSRSIRGGHRQRAREDYDSDPLQHEKNKNGTLQILLQETQQERDTAKMEILRLRGLLIDNNIDPNQETP